MKRTKILMSLLIVGALSIVSCKKEQSSEAAEETNPVEVNDTMMSEPDTVQPAPVNDTNVSGTTSGKMEQVP